MGRSLDAEFVIGYELGRYDPKTYEIIADPLLPDSVKKEFDEEGSAWIGGELEVDDLKFSYFYTMEESAAFGVSVKRVWDYVSEFDAVELAEKVAEMIPRVQEVFNGWGIEEDPKLILVLDYS